MTDSPSPVPGDDPVETRTEQLVVGVLTFRRPAEVCRLLPALLEQLPDAGLPGRVLVVDNDPAGSAREPIARLGLPVDYVVEANPGIAHGRNRVLDEAGSARFVVFIDDDELPAPGWLKALLDTHRQYGTELVVGPVIPDFAAPPEPWLVEGGYFQRPRMGTGTLQPAAGTGNLLLDRAAIGRLGDFRFDPGFGLTGGSDTLFTRQIVAAGGRIVWADDAEVVDVVPVSRMTKRWVRQRAFRGGNCWGRSSLAIAGTPARRAATHAVNGVQGLARIVGGGLRYAAATAQRDPRARATATRTVLKGAGLMSTAVGYVYTEYKRPGDAAPRRRAPRG